MWGGQKGGLPQEMGGSDAKRNFFLILIFDYDFNRASECFRGS